MVRVSVAGASGYTGGELVRWLRGHPEVELVALAAGEQRGRRMEESFPHLRGLVSRVLEGPDWSRLGRESDVVFLALPHGLSMAAVAEILDAGARVIDLGADFRLPDAAAYRRWYDLEHQAPGLLGEAVYGLPERYRDEIAKARLVAAPGCYPTAAILAALPLVDCLGAGTVIVDAKSGVSGAGRGFSERSHFGEVNENVQVYNVGTHRHTPEMERVLAAAGTSRRVFFSPHLIPMTRGILAAVYAPLDRPLTQDEIQARYEETYAREPFVRFLPDTLPQTKATAGSNFCDVAVRVAEGGTMAVGFAALDNLVKGASGQAVQCMNLMCGFPEKEGLWTAPLFP